MSNPVIGIQDNTAWIRFQKGYQGALSGSARNAALVKLQSAGNRAEIPEIPEIQGAFSHPNKAARSTSPAPQFKAQPLFAESSPNKTEAPKTENSLLKLSVPLPPLFSKPSSEVHSNPNNFTDAARTLAETPLNDAEMPEAEHPSAKENSSPPPLLSKPSSEIHSNPNNFTEAAPTLAETPSNDAAVPSAKENSPPPPLFSKPSSEVHSNPNNFTDAALASNEAPVPEAEHPSAMENSPPPPLPSEAPSNKTEAPEIEHPSANESHNAETLAAASDQSKENTNGSLAIDACKKVIRALKKSRLPIDLLKKGTELIAALPYQNFRQVIGTGGKTFVPLVRQIERRKIRLGDSPQSHPRKIELLEALISLQEARTQFQATYIAPVFRINGAGELPGFIMHTESVIPNIIPYTMLLAPNEDPSKMGSYTPTRKELDAIVEKLHDRKDIFPWEYDNEGCFARAQVMLQHLHLMGISFNDLGRAYLLFPLKKKWRYHVAPIVKTDTSDWRVVDPCINQKESSDIASWAAHESEGAPSKEMGQKEFFHENPFHYDNQSFSTFTVNFGTSLQSVDPATGTVVLCPESTMALKTNLSLLGKLRGEKVDAPYLEEQTKNIIP